MKMTKEIEFLDGMRGTITSSWWRYEKSTSALGHRVFCVGNDAEIQAGRLVGGKDVPMIEAKVNGLSLEGARTVGKALCRAMQDAYIAQF